MVYIYKKSIVHIFLMNFPSDEMTSAWCSPSGKGAAHEWQLKILCNTIQILSSCRHLLKIARCHDDILQQLPHLKMESGALQDITDDEFELKDDWKLSATQYKIVRGSDDMLQERERVRGANHYQQAAIPLKPLSDHHCLVYRASICIDDGEFRLEINRYIIQISC